MQKGAAIYSGKVKTLYECDQDKHLIMEFGDDATAFNAVKHEILAGKGATNNRFNAFICEYLAKQGIENHFVKQLNETDSLVKRLQIVPVECVMRNRAAGSICKRLDLELGMELNPPVFEFFFKHDQLGDPMINDSHIITFGWASIDEINQMKQLTHKVNTVLLSLFESKDLVLVDFKLEFGRFDGQIMLGDEFTPDGCRIWDAKTKEIFDKDRFRQDLGDVVAAYQTVADRLMN